jgi:hypothetical protein
MTRWFNTAGPCKVGYHYMIPPIERLPEARELIERMGYFVVHAPRQTGKSTTLMALTQALTAEGRFLSVTPCAHRITARMSHGRSTPGPGTRSESSQPGAARGPQPQWSLTSPRSGVIGWGSSRIPAARSSRRGGPRARGPQLPGDMHHGPWIYWWRTCRGRTRPLAAGDEAVG